MAWRTGLESCYDDGATYATANEAAGALDDLLRHAMPASVRVISSAGVVVMRSIWFGTDMADPPEPSSTSTRYSNAVARIPLRRG